MTDLLLAIRLRRNGILIPRITIARSRAAKLNLADACAMLIMETGGGRDIYGHDPVRNPIKSPDGGSLTVTKHNYFAYRHYRILGYGMQGVGVPQLTWYSFQDLADQYGGGWKVGPQMRVACEHLAALIHRYGEWGGFRAYNGTGPAATSYANTATVQARHFRWVIGGARLADLAAYGDIEDTPHEDRFDTDFPPLDPAGVPLPADAMRGH